jgi:hypothetical protein
MNLGTKDSNGLGPIATKSQTKDKPKVRYPGLSLSGDKVTEFLKECECTLGDTVTATIKLKVTSMSVEYENRLSFDALDLSDISKKGRGPKGIDVFE